MAGGRLLWDQQGSKVPEQAERCTNRPTFALTLPSDLRMLSVARPLWRLFARPAAWSADCFMPSFWRPAKP